MRPWMKERDRWTEGQHHQGRRPSWDAYFSGDLRAFRSTFSFTVLVSGRRTLQGTSVEKKKRDGKMG